MSVVTAHSPILESIENLTNTPDGGVLLQVDHCLRSPEPTMYSCLDALHERVTWPLDSLSGPLGSQIFFAPHPEEAGHWTCSVNLNPPVELSVFELSFCPVAFEVLGRIAVEDCHLTRGGPLVEDSGNLPVVASCWIEALPDFGSEIYWRRIRPAAEVIVNAAPGPVNTSHIFRADPQMRP
ncbi:hypothetical protein A0H81_10072 [Grifola frondosa]|uniref:Uncharacterized protein n=1 Tax=Grifola frondosa TaxID=5627 RepID=A0A1C7LYD0_GRIFR|nr:hypothetical protein A0H81_10072 [Grifola frondosa]